MTYLSHKQPKLMPMKEYLSKKNVDRVYRGMRNILVDLVHNTEMELSISKQDELIDEAIYDIAELLEKSLAKK